MEWRITFVVTHSDPLSWYKDYFKEKNMKADLIKSSEELKKMQKEILYELSLSNKSSASKNIASIKSHAKGVSCEFSCLGDRLPVSRKKSNSSFLTFPLKL